MKIVIKPRHGNVKPAGSVAGPSKKSTQTPTPSSHEEAEGVENGTGDERDMSGEGEEEVDGDMSGRDDEEGDGEGDIEDEGEPEGTAEGEKSSGTRGKGRGKGKGRGLGGTSTPRGTPRGRPRGTARGRGRGRGRGGLTIRLPRPSGEEGSAVEETTEGTPGPIEEGAASSAPEKEKVKEAPMGGGKPFRKIQGNIYVIDGDEFVTEEDEKGNTKIDPHGNLLGGTSILPQPLTRPHHQRWLPRSPF
jgi:chromatin structure-remodeling complex protein RSC7